MAGPVRGVDVVVRNLSTYEKSVVDRVVRAAEMLKVQVANQAKLNHPYTDRTQGLTQSIENPPGDITVTNSGVTAEVIAHKEYASHVEFGTSNSRPYPFMVPALMKHKTAFVRAIARAIRP